MPMRRMLLICLVCAMALASILRYYVDLELLDLGNAPTSNGTAPAAAASSSRTTTIASPLSYNDTRPVAPNGYLCIFGAKGRLNNLILQNLVGIHMAHHLNRTLLMDAEVSKYYDIDRLSLTVYPDSPYLAAARIDGDDGNDDGPGCASPQQISPHSIDHGMTILDRFNDYDRQTSGINLASVDNNDVWYWLGRPPEEVYGRFFRGLVPRRAYQEKVNAFMQRRKLRDRPYNALHLRHFEGKCGNFDTDLCCPKMNYVQDILTERFGNLLHPLFVANDGQCPDEVLRTYANATDPVIMGYDGSCDGTECAVLDFELCVHAEVFVGNLKSSGDMNIREWRMARSDKPGMTSVLSRRPEILQLEERTEYMTRYFVGHWGMRSDCSQVGGRQRNLPCV